MSIKLDLLSQHPNPVFVETGAKKGDGVRNAIDCGFQTIYTIENYPKHVAFCKKTFADYPQVHVVDGDSSVMVWEVIKDIREPITFFLDAHYEGNTPLMKELDQIARHPLKTHTLLIDDMRLFKKGKLPYTVDQILDKVLAINPNYSVGYAKGFVRKDVMVARPK